MIREELAECDAFHDYERPDCAGFLPTRLIDVGDEVGGLSPRLVLTANLLTMYNASIAVSLQYIALSYCWGSSNDAATQFKTEKASLPTHLAGFSISSASRVIRDAIVVARSLGIQYLWVDALCIWECYPY